MKLITIVLFAAPAAFAEIAESRMPVTDAEKIADALSAGPVFVAKDATVCDWPSTPGLVVAGDVEYNDLHLYTRDFDRLAGTTTTARWLYDKMLELYPHRVNPGLALWLSAPAAKP